MKQRVRVDNLFEKWDNEGSGYLEMQEIETIVHKYKDGLEKQAINRGKLWPARWDNSKLHLVFTRLIM